MEKTNMKGKYIIFRDANTSDVIVALYPPSGILKEKQELRQSFFCMFKKQIGQRTSQKDNIILLGEFNTILIALNRSTGDLREKEAKSELENLLQQFDLDDH